MLRKGVFILLLMIALTKVSYSAENLICLGVNWQLGLMCGIEHKFNSRIGVKSDIGLAVPGIIFTDALLVIYLLPEGHRCQLNICSGVLTAAVPLGARAAMLSLGATLLGRYHITERRSIDLRLGEGFPLFFEKDKDIIRDIHFPFGLWPDIAIGMSFKI